MLILLGEHSLQKYLPFYQVKEILKSCPEYSTSETHMLLIQQWGFAEFHHTTTIILPKLEKQEEMLISNIVVKVFLKDQVIFT